MDDEINESGIQVEEVETLGTMIDRSFILGKIHFPHKVGLCDGCIVTSFIEGHTSTGHRAGNIVKGMKKLIDGTDYFGVNCKDCKLLQGIPFGGTKKMINSGDYRIDFDDRF
jgi:hypothetical protein